MKPGADWLGWTLQCLVGMAVGAGVGFYALSDCRHTASSPLNHPMQPGQLSFFLWGAAFIGGALASHFGDRLWMRNAYLLLQPDAPRQSWASCFASLGLGFLGVALIAASFPSLRALF